MYPTSNDDKEKVSLVSISACHSPVYGIIIFGLDSDGQSYYQKWGDEMWTLMCMEIRPDNKE